MAERTVHELDAAQLRVLANPLRQRILGLLCGEALSATRLGEVLPEAPANLHYHLERLREAGLIELVETRRVRGAVEKLFRAVARNFAVSSSALDELGGAASTRLLPGVREGVEDVLGALGEAFDAGGGPPLVSYQRLRLTPAAAAELRERLRDWLHACREADRAPESAGEGAEAMPAEPEPVEEWVVFASFVRRDGGGT
ncbi:MAG: ArsR/SmtB family transcription factor [Gemmatimonadota bacterium]